MTRTYTVTLPPGMAPHGRTARTFAAVEAFDGYVAAIRQAGYLVTFSNPTACTVTRQVHA